MGAAPEASQVGAVRDEGEAREPGSVEAGCADDDVDFVVFAFVVDEACFGNGADGVGEGGCVFRDKGFEVARCWGGSSTARVEVLWNHFLYEMRVVVELLAHLLVGILARNAGGFAALHDEFEALVELVFDLFAVFEVFLWVVLEESELFFTVWGGLAMICQVIHQIGRPTAKVCAVLASPCLCKARCDPDR